METNRVYFYLLSTATVAIQNLSSPLPSTTKTAKVSIDCLKMLTINFLLKNKEANFPQASFLGTPQRLNLALSYRALYLIHPGTSCRDFGRGCGVLVEF